MSTINPDDIDRAYAERKAARVVELELQSAAIERDAAAFRTVRLGDPTAPVPDVLRHLPEFSAPAHQPPTGGGNTPSAVTFNEVLPIVQAKVAELNAPGAPDVPEADAFRQCRDAVRAQYPNAQDGIIRGAFNRAVGR